MAVYNDILKVLIWKNKVNEESNIVYVCVRVCIIYKCKSTKHSTQKAEIAKLNEKARLNPLFFMRNTLFISKE